LVSGVILLKQAGMENAVRVKSPIAWVPSLYVAMGIPYSMVCWVAGTMFKNLGVSDTKIALATGSVGIAWSLKPLWASFLDMYRTKKFWVLSMEFLIALLLALVAGVLPLPEYFRVVIGILWVLAFASSTQDICADGVYITTLEKSQQAKWIGWQGAAWNTGRIFATALVVYLAGKLQESGQSPKTAWAIALCFSALVMAGLGLYHWHSLPTGTLIRRPENAAEIVKTFTETVVDFLKKPQIVGMLLFVFFYRIGEGFLLVEAPLFMQAPLAKGGLGLSLADKAFLDGAISTGVSLMAGVLGGMFIAKYGLKKSLMVMALCMNIPHLCFVYLSHAVTPAAPLSLTTIGVLVTIEKFGYSFGFVANMLYMMQQISPGKYHMTHYAFCTALMNLVLVPTQAASGFIADHLGYKNYFVFVAIASIPSIFAAWFAPFPREEPAPGGEALRAH
jgi:MFS transporter, PAT family, beta-lactamase induction signal transducer AmpG